MSKQIISMGKTGSPLTVEELSELLTSKIKEGVLTGKEVISDYENTEWCLMGLKKQGSLLMFDFEEDNEEYMNLLEKENYYISNGCCGDDVIEGVDILEVIKKGIENGKFKTSSNDHIIETVEKLEGEKHE